MGLAFSNADASWSYSGFNNFRRKLAKEVGIDWDKFTGDFIGRREPDETEIQKLLDLKDPIALFLNHSDCDGELTPTECLKIAPRLLTLIARWPTADYDYIMATRLAVGMLDCSMRNISMEFC